MQNEDRKWPVHFDAVLGWCTGGIAAQSPDLFFVEVEADDRDEALTKAQKLCPKIVKLLVDEQLVDFLLEPSAVDIDGVMVYVQLPCADEAKQWMKRWYSTAEVRAALQKEVQP